MATDEATTVVVIGVNSKELDLERLVQNTTWKELLLDLVQKNQLDPWDIDLGKIVDGYVDAVRRMKVLDLHIPANMILAASVLLRIKSETVVIASWDEPPEPEAQLALGERILPDVPALVSKLRMQPHKKVTLQELMDALDEATQIKEERDGYLDNHHEIVDFAIDSRDIDEKIDRIYDMVKGHIGADGMTTFSELARPYSGSSELLVELFIPLIFLSHKEKINMMQEEFFGDILISINGVAQNG
jgi:segregation and condensation protein A